MSEEPSVQVDGAPEAAENATYQRSERAASVAWHTCFDVTLPGYDPECPGCMKEANPMRGGEYVAGRVRECGRWHPDGAVEHNRANCWLYEEQGRCAVRRWCALHAASQRPQRE